MREELFTTDQEIAEAIATFQAGMTTPFWVLMCKIIDENIKIAKDQLENGTGEENDETPESIARIRDRLKLLREIRYTPETMIIKLQEGEPDKIEVDPYTTVEKEELDKAS